MKEFDNSIIKDNVSDLEKKNLTFDENFSCLSKSVTIKAGKTIRVDHNLKSVPKYRIIVRQSGNGLITDGEQNTWTDKYITLKNNGAENVTLTVLIVRS